ncbi:YraN family protein [Enteractinococcus helveticum]|uniref:UPF0102 protein A6F49_01005 n=1 Tax=Enteractinococcus helveticum TaxID=1837282 RepID=A0A1B7LVC9_9MICC|nr:YraN family protein [Enteractinococcus helveticum]OAV52187.1 hypothetical protein A6F49_01005 [Enteractinococcus helveticum]
MTINPSQNDHIALGDYGEEIAIEALTNAGYRILEHNWPAPTGEVDIIAYQRQQLVALEVKTRSGMGFGDPLGSVSATQLRRIQCGLLHYKQAVYPRYAHTSMRIDVVGILIDSNGEIAADLLQDVG